MTCDFPHDQDGIDPVLRDRAVSDRATPEAETPAVRVDIADAARDAAAILALVAAGPRACGWDTPIRLEGRSISIRNAYDAVERALAALEPAPVQGWRTDMENAPKLDRLMVGGWQPATKTVAGYWWYEEDCTDLDGVPIGCPTATIWHAMPLLPPAPQDGGQA